MMMMGLAKGSGVEGSAELRVTVRKSVSRGLSRCFAVVLVACAAAAYAAMFLRGFDAYSITIVGSGMLLAGGVVALICIRVIAVAIATVVTRSIELLLQQPHAIDECVAETAHWANGTSLTWRQVNEDVEVLRRLIRRGSRQAADIAAQLSEARQKVDEYSKEKSQFLAKIRHELRTPLNAILGYATLLHRESADAANEAAAADLERIMVAGRRLSTAVNDMLGLPKIESGTSMVERNVINVRALLEEVVSSEPVHARNKISVDVRFDREIGIIIGDPEKLSHCLANLLASAAESNEEADVAFSVTQLRDAAVPSVCFMVQTTCTSSDGERPARSEGCDRADLTDGGLRLAVTRRMAKLMGGDCTIEQATDGRFVARLVLPFIPAKSSQAAVGVEEIEPSLAGGHVRRKCALIVDDDDAARDLMRRWLREMGYHVLIALDGETGLKIAREERPDLILLDGFLPGRSGYEILAELRADPLIGGIPVIFVTVDDDRCRGIQCGASEYLRKPLTPEALRSALDVYAGTSAGEILIIDDDDDAAELIRRSLVEVGFSTRRAGDGLEGLAMISAERPEAIVLDLRMPLMDGFAVIDHLARNEDLNSIPIVVLSSHDMNIAEHRRLTSAAHRVFTKGMVSPRQIAESLKEAVA